MGQEWMRLDTPHRASHANIFVLGVGGQTYGTEIETGDRMGGACIHGSCDNDVWCNDIVHHQCVIIWPVIAI